MLIIQGNINKILRIMRLLLFCKNLLDHKINHEITFKD